MERIRTAKWAWLCLAWLVLCSAPAMGQALSVELLHAEGDTQAPPTSAPARARWRAATPADAVVLELPQHRGGYWLRLRTDRDIARAEQRLLVLRGARAYRQARYYLPGADRGVTVDTAAGSSMLLNQGWAIPLRVDWKRGDAVYVHLHGGIAMGLSLRLIDRAELERVVESERRFVLLAYGTIALMALAIASLWIVQRESLYLYYAAYLVSIGGYLLVMSGEAAGMLARLGLSDYRMTASWVLATCSTIFQLGFSLHFLELPRLLPRAASFVRLLQWANIAWLTVLLVLLERSYGFWYLGGNGLLLLTIPMLLGSAVVSWRRGAKFAGYYLLGWAPLMVFAGLLAANAFGIGGIEWGDRGLVVAVVLESGVLVLALTQRAAQRYRHELLHRAAPH